MSFIIQYHHTSDLVFPLFFPQQLVETTLPIHILAVLSGTRFPYCAFRCTIIIALYFLALKETMNKQSSSSNQ